MDARVARIKSMGLKKSQRSGALILILLSLSSTAQEISAPIAAPEAHSTGETPSPEGPEIAPPAPIAAPAYAQKLRDAGFTCSDDSLSYTCIGKLSPYPGKVALVFSKTAPKLTKGWTHLHGYRLGLNRDKSFQNLLDDFKFGSLLNQNGLNDTVMLIPESQGKNATHLSYFTGSAPYEKLYKAAGTALGEATLGFETLSGHSGAFKPIGNILRTEGARVKKVIFYDASYYSPDALDSVAKWTKTRDGSKFINMYRKNTATGKGQSYLKGKLATTDRWSSIAVSEDSNHWDMVEKNFSKAL